MVWLSGIYTGFGDDGLTALGSGVVVSKCDVRVKVLGLVDEACSVLGVVLSVPVGLPVDVRGVLVRVQNELFDVGADLAVPVVGGELSKSVLRVVKSQVVGLEALIDFYNEGLEPLSSFVLPGGSVVGGLLFWVRSVVRRAEVGFWDLVNSGHGDVDTGHGRGVNVWVGRYLNRLSDLLFVLARFVNQSSGVGEVLWVPGLLGAPSGSGNGSVLDEADESGRAGSN